MLFLQPLVRWYLLPFSRALTRPRSPFTGVRFDTFFASKTSPLFLFFVSFVSLFCFFFFFWIQKLPYFLFIASTSIRNVYMSEWLGCWVFICLMLYSMRCRRFDIPFTKFNICKKYAFLELFIFMCDFRLWYSIGIEPIKNIMDRLSMIFLSLCLFANRMILLLLLVVVVKVMVLASRSRFQFGCLGDVRDATQEPHKYTFGRQRITKDVMSYTENRESGWGPGDSVSWGWASRCSHSVYSFDYKNINCEKGIIESK